MVYAYHAYLLGIWPPQEKSLLKTKLVVNNLALAHIKAHRLIHGIYKKRNLAPPMVSIAKNMQAFESCTPTLKNRLGAYLRDRSFNFGFLEKLFRHKSLDFIGVNYYTRGLVHVTSWMPDKLFSESCSHSRLAKNNMGWDIYPEGLYKLLLRLAKFGLPIFILENGICIEDDNLRWDFIRAHLNYLNLAMQQGAKVIGYIHWSLIDNYEWDKGFGMRFGLIDVDYNTYRRSIRESARKFAQVCRTNKLDICNI
jgi:beta-glucosidase